VFPPEITPATTGNNRPGTRCRRRCTHAAMTLPVPVKNTLFYTLQYVDSVVKNSDLESKYTEKYTA